MDDHFWPSVYPGLIVGVLVGISARSLAGVAAGAIGGLAGAYALYRATIAFGIGGDVLPLVAVIGGALAGAQGLVMLVQRLTRRGEAG